MGKIIHFPPPKKGKLRRVMKQRTFQKDAAWRSVPYVRHGVRTEKSRPDRANWKRSVKMIYKATPKELILMFRADKIVKKLEGVQCSACKKGKLGRLVFEKGRGWVHKCGTCKVRHLPHSAHPIFRVGGGRHNAPLEDQAAVLFSLLSGATQAATHKVTGQGHCLIESISERLDRARKKYVEREEKNIKFGIKGKLQIAWKDNEADEVDFKKEDMPSEGKAKFEQWGGVVERGERESLVLFRLNPKTTSQRAPGPGPIRKVDWKKFAMKRLKGTKNHITHRWCQVVQA